MEEKSWNENQTKEDLEDTIVLQPIFERQEEEMEPPQPIEPMTLNETQVKPILKEEIEEVNQPEVVLEETPDSIESPIESPSVVEPSQESNLTPNAYTGTYLLMAMLMLGMILLSIAGITLS